jgi:hypothetical protein
VRHRPRMGVGLDRARGVRAAFSWHRDTGIGLLYRARAGRRPRSEVGLHSPCAEAICEYRGIRPATRAVGPTGTAPAPDTWSASDSSTVRPRRTQAGDDLLTCVSQASHDGEKMTVEDLVVLRVTRLGANDTTRCDMVRAPSSLDANPCQERTDGGLRAPRGNVINQVPRMEATADALPTHRAGRLRAWRQLIQTAAKPASGSNRDEDTDLDTLDLPDPIDQPTPGVSCGDRRPFPPPWRRSGASRARKLWAS